MIEVYGQLDFLTYTVFDEAVGEEVERLEVVPCRRPADGRCPRPKALSPSASRSPETIP
jgi:hypothetical protein